MTNAIETTKREMYAQFIAVKAKLIVSCPNAGHIGKYVELGKFESAMEAHLEQLRQQYEQMADMARERFETIQSLEQSGQDLTAKLSDMTEERDAIRNRIQTFEFANKSAGEFLIDALRKVKSQRKTIKALRKAQEACESSGSTSASSCEEISPDAYKDEPKPHSQSSARPVDGITYVSTTEKDGVVSIYCTACHRMTKKVEANNFEDGHKFIKDSWR